MKILQYEVNSISPLMLALIPLGLQYTVIPRSPFFACTPKYCRLQKLYKMRLNICFNEMALFGPFAALIKGCSSYGRNGGQTTRGDG